MIIKKGTAWRGGEPVGGVRGKGEGDGSEFDQGAFYIA